MKKITQEELDKILENHLHYLNKDCENWEDMKANLNNYDLSHMNLKGAKLTGADLRYSDLFCADLSNAYVCDADVRNANLMNANLTNTTLIGSNLENSKLTRANLFYADLRYSLLSNTDLTDACLQYANLRHTKNTPFIPMICPEEGSFIAYKLCNNYIVKLQILEDARRLSGTSRKCRCDKAKILSIENLDGTIADIEGIISIHNKDFMYKVGEIVEEPDFDMNRWDDWSTGIMFFMSRQEAVDYNRHNPPLWDYEVVDYGPHIPL